MLKRLITAFLALTMVLTMCSGYAVFAAVPAGNNETDGNETVIGFKRIDNLNSYTVDTALNYNGYPMANQSSDVLVQGAQNGGSIIAGAGRDGSAVLQLNSFGESSSWRSVRQTTANITMSATDIMMFNFDFKVVSYPGVKETTHIGGVAGRRGLSLTQETTDGVTKYYFTTHDGNKCEYKKDTWYRLVQIQKQDDRYVYCYEIDGNNETLVLSGAGAQWNEYPASNYASGTTATDLAYLFGSSEAAATMVVQFDNLEFVKYDMTEYAPSVISDNMTDKENVPVNTQSIEITFDQPIEKLPSELNLTGTESTAICTVSATGKLNTYKISWSDALEYENEYTLGLTGFLNGAGTACANSITFSTEKEPEAAPPTIDDLKLVDNFNSYTVDTALNYNGYPMANQSSDVLVQGAQNGGNIVAGAGRDGGAVLQLNSFGESSSWRSVRQTTANIIMSATDIMMFNFEFKVVSYPGIKETTHIGGVAGRRGLSLTQETTDGVTKYYFTTHDGNKCEYKKDTWYRLVQIQKQDDRYVYCYEIDGNNETLVLSGAGAQWNEYPASNYASGTTATDLAYLFGSSEAAATTVVQFDNLEFVKYDMTEYAPSVISDNMTDKENVSVNTQSIEITFDQPIEKLPSELNLTGTGSSAICTVAATDKLNTYKISWSNVLEGSTDYVLNLNGFLNGADVGCRTSINFSTSDAGIITLTDGFENEEMFSVNGTSYADGSDSWFGTASSTIEGNITRAEGMGYNGSAAIELKRLSETGYDLRSKSKIAIGENDAYVVTSRVKVTDKGIVTENTDENGTTTYINDFALHYGVRNAEGLRYIDRIATICVNRTAGSTWITAPGFHANETENIELDRWYNTIMTVKQDGYGFKLTDTITGEKIWEHYIYTDGVTENEYLKREKTNPEEYLFDKNTEVYIYNGAMAGGTNAETKPVVLMDDLSLWRVKTNREAHRLSLISSEENKTISLDGTISMTFNQPIVADGKEVNLYQCVLAENSTEEENVLVTNSDVIVSCDDFCTLELSFTNLLPESKYVIDYSGLAAESGVDFGEASVNCVLIFTTDNSENMTIVSNGKANGITKDCVLSFDIYSQTAIAEQKVIAAFYDANAALIGIEETVVNFEGNETETAIFNLSKDYSQAESIKIMVWTDNMKPLMKSRLNKISEVNIIE